MRGIKRKFRALCCWSTTTTTTNSSGNLSKCRQTFNLKWNTHAHMYNVHVHTSIYICTLNWTPAFRRTHESLNSSTAVNRFLSLRKILPFFQESNKYNTQQQSMSVDRCYFSYTCECLVIHTHEIFHFLIALLLFLQYFFFFTLMFGYAFMCMSTHQRWSFISGASPSTICYWTS